MAKFIDKEALLQDIGDSVRFSSRNGVSAEMRGATKIVDRIVSAPTVDVIEVVRCKDCKHRKTAECLMYVECDCGSQHTWECDNDFCSYGERRTNDA